MFDNLTMFEMENDEEKPTNCTLHSKHRQTSLTSLLYRYVMDISTISTSLLDNNSVQAASSPRVAPVSCHPQPQLSLIEAEAEDTSQNFIPRCK